MNNCISETEFSNPLKIDNKLLSNDNDIVNILNQRKNKFNKESSEKILNSKIEDDIQLNNNEKVIESFSLDVPMINSLYGLIAVSTLVALCCFLKK